MYSTMDVINILNAEKEKVQVNINESILNHSNIQIHSFMLIGQKTILEKLLCMFDNINSNEQIELINAKKELEKL